jgi:hypothetical protein
VKVKSARFKPTSRRPTATIHSARLIGDIGFGFYRVVTDCGIELDDWVEVVVKEATCNGCLTCK